MKAKAVNLTCQGTRVAFIASVVTALSLVVAVM